MNIEASVLVLIGGFIGGIARFGLARFVDGKTGNAFPWGTLAVNLSGAFLAGVLAGLAQSTGSLFSSEMVRAFLMIGVLGGYTTVSSFVLQSHGLAREGEMRLTLIYIAASAIFGVVAAFAGFALAA
ncbi:fluoride efflux transporter CrcB [Phyllobacterium leguminum]|uniref:fluoride efflux transporter CrcB n=1 Tax=Phyllobacterium leguminum TaxID=314237 RepID=UPI000DA170BA|nr:fluoride efflux transporter CrcB [Phyllobacterium leguminum]